MKGAEFSQLQVFVAAAERGNFREAANHLGLAPSTMSQTIRALEDRLDVRLFNRTTRSVRLTTEGEALLQRLKPLLQDLEQAIEVIHGDNESKRIRLVCPSTAAQHVFASLVGKFSAQNPDVEIELVIDDTITNIVESNFDAGVHIGYMLEKDMVALPLTPDQPVCVVAAPDYIAKHGKPASPRELHNHRCIRITHATNGVAFRWHFRENGRDFGFLPSGNFSINNYPAGNDIVLEGAGIGYMLTSAAQPHIATGRLVQLLQEYTIVLPGFHIYFVQGRHMSGALRLFLDFLKANRPVYQQQSKVI